jgi:hypothetical protein
MGLCSPGRAADSAKEQTGLVELSLQVSALQALYEFEFTVPQLQSLLKIAKQAAPKSAPAKAGQASDKYRQALTELRDALTEAKDDDRIKELNDKVVDLFNSEEPDLDDDIEITAAGRRLAPEALKLLGYRQVLAFLDANSDVHSDPFEMLVAALDQSRTLADDEWKDLAEDTVEQLGWMLGGLDRKKARVVEQKVEQWLAQVRGLKEAEFKKRRADLENSARQFVALIPPTAVIHNVVEHALAEMLSNPQLTAVLEARLKDK